MTTPTNTHTHMSSDLIYPKDEALAILATVHSAGLDNASLRMRLQAPALNKQNIQLYLDTLSHQELANLVYQSGLNQVIAATQRRQEQVTCELSKSYPPNPPSPVRDQGQPG